MSETRWGLPTANKTAFLLHGLTSSSQCWFRVAHYLVEAGYYVIAPDLLGHGVGGVSSATYRISDFAAALEPLLDSLPPLDLIVGHSLGALVSAALADRYVAKIGCRLVLLDPPFEMSNELVATLGPLAVEEVRRPGTAADYLAQNPAWTMQDAVIKVTGSALCRPEVVEAICEHNQPWSFTHLVTKRTSYMTGPEIIILGADPATGAHFFSPDEAWRMQEILPDADFAYVVGSGHSIHREQVRVLVNVLVTGSLRGKGLASYDNELGGSGESSTTLNAFQM